MIYVCVPSYNEAATVGLLCWKVRQVFTRFPREYQLLVVDDGSTDATREVLESYTRVLPLTVLRHASRQGYARGVEELLRTAVDRTDRPKRDCAVLMHADFCHGPDALPDLIRRMDSGADMVVAEGTFEGHTPRALRLVRRSASLLLGSAGRVPGVDDPVSGFAAFRLVTLRNTFRAQTGGGALLIADGWAANAELFSRAARHARRIDTIQVVERHDLRQRESRVKPWETAKAIWRAGRQLRRAGLPPLPTPAAAEAAMSDAR